MRKFAVAVMGLAVWMSLALPASAAPDRAITLSPATRAASWTSPVNSGTFILHTSPRTNPQTKCLQGCDETLVRLIKPGTLRIDVTARESVSIPSFSFLELTVFRSDATGTKGKTVGGDQFGAEDGGSVLVKNAVPGYYLAEVAWYEGVSSIVGKATFTPAKSR